MNTQNEAEKNMSQNPHLIVEKKEEKMSEASPISEASQDKTQPQDKIQPQINNNNLLSPTAGMTTGSRK